LRVSQVKLCGFLAQTTLDALGQAVEFIGGWKEVTRTNAQLQAQQQARRGRRSSVQGRCCPKHPEAAPPWRARRTFPFRLTTRSRRARPLSLLRVHCSPILGPAGQKAVETTHAEADDSSARSVSRRVRKKRVRPAGLWFTNPYPFEDAASRRSDIHWQEEPRVADLPPQASL